MNIAVYCGSNKGNSEKFGTLTIELGKWIVKNKHNLVYGAGNVGLMELIADTVLEGGQQVHGIIPHFLVEKELVKTNLTSLSYVETMQERKNEIIKQSEVYIALPGGPGTLEEITEVISLRDVEEHLNPCILLNLDGYYDSLKTQYKIMIDNGFLSPDFNNYVFFVDDISELNSIIV